MQKNDSKSVVFVKGKVYDLCRQSSVRLMTANFGVRKNSFLLSKSASKTAIVLLIEIPLANNTKKKYCFAFSFHLFPQIFRIM